MTGSLFVDTASLHDLALAGRRARREVETEAEALRHGGRDGGRATQQDELEARYDSLHRHALDVLAHLTDSLGDFGTALERIADGYAAAEASQTAAIDPVPGAGAP